MKAKLSLTKIPTECILPATGVFTLGLFAGIIVFVIIFLPQYRREVNRVHYADEVINECTEYYSDFYDVIAEGDVWEAYVASKEY